MIDAIGYVAATLTTLAFVPQVLKIWRSGRADDLSLTMLGTFCAGLTIWLVYGVILGSTPIVVANAVTLALNAVLIALKLRGRRMSPIKSRRSSTPG